MSIVIADEHIVIADDLNLPQLFAILASESGLCRIAHDVEVIATYARDNGLMLNFGKFKVIIQGSGAFMNRINVNALPPITVNEASLLFVDRVRNLRVVMSSNFSWRGHVSNKTVTYVFINFRIL